MLKAPTVVKPLCHFRYPVFSDVLCYRNRFTLHDTRVPSCFFLRHYFLNCNPVAGHSKIPAAQAQMKQVMKVWGYSGENMVVGLFPQTFFLFGSLLFEEQVGSLHAISTGLGCFDGVFRLFGGMDLVQKISKCRETARSLGLSWPLSWLMCVSGTVAGIG